ncbi:MAG TPA: type 1 glutamine amidotransferase domain-containing protein [Candidatus Saccharimonadales bacterium]|nr:type 1 glutamine amidotransferase domain-containing protein [Candidatus Saccharimonadales bacterium]
MKHDISGKHIAILVHNYFEQAEFEEPLSALKNAGAEVTVISADEQKLRGLNHVERGDNFEADLLLDQASPEDYDALVLPGGAINADNLRVVETAKQWVLDFLEAGKPLAVICHAPWVLVSADAVEGRRLTSYHTIRDDIVNAGGEWVNQAVVIDDNLITSRQPDDLPQFNDALINMLSEQPSSAIQDAADTPPPANELTNEAETRLRSLGYDPARDQLEDEDEEEILEDDDITDPEQLHPSGVAPKGERGDTY